jgi:UDP-N-acetylmuramoyl-tripeptide--D-alanyl-D-alanine ligase
MRGLGQIAELTTIAPPNLAVITNIAPVHSELLGSVENIARAKCEILDGLAPNGAALVNGDIDMLVREARKHQAPLLTFGRGDRSDVRLVSISHNGKGMLLDIDAAGDLGQVFVPIHSEQLALNVAAAVGAARYLRVSWEHIGEALHMFTPTGHRLRVLQGEKEIQVIDDCYNANALSMRAALETMSQLAEGRQRIAVLGEMYEMGCEARSAHLEVGWQAAGCADRLFTVGPMGGWIAEGARDQGMPSDLVVECQDNANAVKRLRETLQGGEIVLVKGSRGLKMEEIVSCLVGGSSETLPAG